MREACPASCMLKLKSGSFVSSCSPEPVQAACLIQVAGAGPCVPQVPGSEVFMCLPGSASKGSASDLTATKPSEACEMVVVLVSSGGVLPRCKSSPARERCAEGIQ